MLDIKNLVKSISTELISKNELENFTKQIEERLNNMEKYEIGYYTIDRFEGNTAVIENRENQKMINVNRKDLPEGAKEGSILKYENEKFTIDEKEQEEIEKRIKEKMDNLWSN